MTRSNFNASSAANAAQSILGSAMGSQTLVASCVLRIDAVARAIDGCVFIDSEQAPAQSGAADRRCREVPPVGPQHGLPDGGVRIDAI